MNYESPNGTPKSHSQKQSQNSIETIEKSRNEEKTAQLKADAKPSQNPASVAPEADAKIISSAARRTSTSERSRNSQRYRYARRARLSETNAFRNSKRTV